MDWIRHRRTDRAVPVVILTLLVVFAAGCSSGKASPATSAQPAASDKGTISIGILADALPLGIVKEEGWLEHEGYTVKWSEFLSGVPGEVAATVSGSLDIGEGNTSGMMPVLIKDPGLTEYVANEGSNVVQILARKGSGITTVKGLEGKTIATAGVKTAANAVLEVAFAKDNIPLSSATFPNAAGPEQIPAMKNGTVEAAVSYVPFSSEMMLNGTATLLTTANKVYGGPWMAGGLFARTAFAKQHPDAVKAVVAALARADRLLKNQPTTAYQLLAKFNQVPVKAIQYSYQSGFIGLVSPTPNASDLVAEGKVEQQYGALQGDVQKFVTSWVTTKFSS
jgi:ABC-type nitrate/sulfonate/bicarbonate transport system substrate-binding protein